MKSKYLLVGFIASLFFLSNNAAAQDENGVYHIFSAKDTLGIKDPLKVKRVVLYNMESMLRNKAGKFVWKCLNIEELTTDQKRWYGIHKLKKLKKLDLTSLRFDSYKDLEMLTTLEELNLSYKSFSEIPPEVSALKNLKRLDISNTQVSSIPNSLSQLEYINIAGTSVSSINNLPNLTSLTVGDNNIFKFVSVLKKKTTIKSLGIFEVSIDENNANKYSSLGKKIAGLKHLEQLMINSHMVSMGEELGKLTNLKRLELVNAPMIPKSIGKLQKLEYVNFYDGQYKTIPKEIGLLKNLKVLNISRYIESNPTIKKIPEEIFNLTSLEELYLSYQYGLKNPDLSKISQLKKLKVLELSSLEIKKFPQEILQLSQLEKLDLSSNKILSIPSEIKKLQNLKVIIIDDNNISTLPSEIGMLTNLIEIDMSWNKIPAIPQEVTKLKKLRKFNYNQNSKYVENIEIPASVQKFIKSNYILVGYF